MKTQAEIEELKRQWRYDPCWDIDDVEGFEDYKDELLEFSKAQIAIWNFEAEERAKARAIEIGTPDNPTLTETIVRMQNRIGSIMERLDKIEEGRMVYR